MQFKQILVPTDFSDGAREALRAACKLAGSDGHIALVHVWHPPFVYSPEATFSPQVIKDLHQQAEKSLANAKAEALAFGAKLVTTTFLIGTGWHEIVELARRHREIDAIVMGTHGRSGIAHALLGSVAEKVVRHAPCPVLVIRNRS